MLDINKLVQWQVIDERCNIPFPWWTHPCLERLAQMDLSDKIILEYGGGWSTCWFAKNAAHVYTIEAKPDWTRDIKEWLEANNLSHKATVICREINEGNQERASEYLEIPPLCDPDVICVDGILRNNCLELTIELGKIRPRLVIADNFQQAMVWMSDAAVEIMSPYESEIFEQSDHTDNDGVNKWKTAFFYVK